MPVFRRKNKATAYVIEDGTALRRPQQMAGSMGYVQIVGSRARLANKSKRRIGMCAVVFGIAFSALGVRLGYVALGGNDAVKMSDYPTAQDYPAP